jgi:hypothetical protein
MQHFWSGAAARALAFGNEHLSGGVEMKTRQGWMGRGLLFVVCGLTFGALVVACGSTKTSTGGGSGTGGGAGAGGGSGAAGSAAGIGSTICGETAADACDVCLLNKCCTEVKACVAVAACANLVSCSSNCPSTSTTCPTDCANTYPGGVTQMTTLYSCIQAKCATECA